jgi:SAM-dependent methyltransferase
MIQLPRLRCPVCGSTFEKYRHDWLFMCSGCGLLASNLEPMIPEQTGQTVLDEDRRVHGLSDIRTRNNKIVLEQIKSVLTQKSNRLLDVGSGFGFFLTDAVNHNFHVSGIEPDPNMFEELRKTGLRVRRGYFPYCLHDGEEFDVIVFNDVLEHIQDLVGTLDACMVHLAPGGLLVLNCPNRKGVFYRIADLLDRTGAHGPFNRMWQREIVSPHVWYFEPNDLKRLGERRGLTVITTLRLLPVTLRGISDRIFYVRNQSRLLGTAALLGAFLLIPFLTILPRDISVVILKKEIV